ncbi:MAG: hypothetical protein ACXU9C_29505, partial [Xanthobacteraceae bacterium]
MHDPDHKKHAILKNIVYNNAYNIAGVPPILPPGWAFCAGKLGIFPQIQWIRFGTRLACLKASFIH